MNRMIIVLICAITVFSITAAAIAGGVSQKRSAHLLQLEIEKAVLDSAEKYANGFSATFNHVEGLVDSVASSVSVTFDEEKFLADPAYLDDYKIFLKDIVKQTLSHTKIAHGLYVTFNPELRSTNDEVWYAYKDGKIEYIEAKFAENRRDFSLPVKEDMEYFFQPIYDGRGTWTSPYFDKDIGITVVSYSVPIYAGDLLIGVAGADITTEDTLDLIQEVKNYNSGYAFLLDEKLNFIVHPKYTSKDNFAKIENGALAEHSSTLLQNEEGIIKYALEDMQIMSFSHFDNGWIIAITQPYSEAFQPINSLNSITVALFVLLFTFVILSAVLFSLLFARPIQKMQDHLEGQNREKQQILLYQSRQAKMGEMLGNITHQWKQPLNSIHLIVVNLLDAYHYGEFNKEKLERSAAKIDGIIEKMSDTIADFTDFLKPERDQIRFNVNDSIEKTISLMEESLEYNRIKVQFQPLADAFSYGCPNEFIHVIFNILDNGRDAVIESGATAKQISITLTFSEKGEGRVGKEKNGYIEIKICNIGNSIPEDVLERVFEPYFTTKDKKSGTGIGLYLSKIIIEERMGGKINLENIEDGVCCLIRIPYCSAGEEIDYEGREH